MPFNLNQLLALMRGGQSPQALIFNLLQQNAQGNPLMTNLFNLAKGNNTQAIENIVRNMAKEKGIDYDAEFTKFKKQLGFLA